MILNLLFPNYWNEFLFSTGAGSGIGRAACQVLSREGAIVVAADKNYDAAMETIKTHTALASGKNGRQFNLTGLQTKSYYFITFITSHNFFIILIEGVKKEGYTDIMQYPS